ncbi:ATP-binding protein [Natronomonas sp. EA1]|uniref:Dph6-related ATP pyrophosphatase n=1 Tax=Natronomonas sp. EA1 TaxID=3421655 RepID=UPI003EBB7913
MDALAWSGGKDAALALRELEDPLLLCVLAGGRTRGHRLLPELIRAQADALGLRVAFVDLPENPSNDAYEQGLADAFGEHDIDRIAYADLFVEPIREYREGLLARCGVEGVWPLWGRDTEALFDEFVAEYRAVACVVDDSLGPAFLGRELSPDFRADLPPDADPCGENGEYHTFVTDGPGFAEALSVEVGDTHREHNDHTGRHQHYADLRLPQPF